MKNVKRNYLLISGIILLVLASAIGVAIAQDNKQPDDRSKDIVEEIKPYEGSFGPGSALYGFKIGLENLREGLTFDERQKIEIQLEHARDRIAEAEAELRNRNDDAANIAMDHFVEKIQTVDDRITGIDRNDTGLLEAQREIVKHRFVLEHLLDDHPNSRGLRKAVNNSLKLEDKFESRTDRSIVPVVSRDGVTLKEARREELRNIGKKAVEARIVGNDTEIKVRVKFVSTSSDRDAIAQEILNQLQLNRTEIDNLLEIHIVDFEELNETLEARANAGRNISEVEAEFRLSLMKTTNRTDLVNGIAQKLSSLTKDRILNSLEFRVRERREIREINETEKLQVRAKIIGNATKARVRVEFVTDKTDLTAIAQEILDRLNLSETSIDNLLEIEVAQREELRERQEARISTGKIIDIRREDRRDPEAQLSGVAGEIGDVRREDRVVRAAAFELREDEPGDDRGGNREVEAGDDRGMAGETGDVRREDWREDRRDRHSDIGIGNNFSEVGFETEFVLNTVDRPEIVNGIFRKLSVLMVQDVLNSVEKAKIEIKQKMEDRRELEIRHEQEAERGGAGEADRGGGSSGSGGGRGK